MRHRNPLPPPIPKIEPEPQGFYCCDRCQHPSAPKPAGLCGSCAEFVRRAEHLMQEGTDAAVRAWVATWPPAPPPLRSWNFGLGKLRMFFEELDALPPRIVVSG